MTALAAVTWRDDAAAATPIPVKPRYAWIDAARGVGITLVVFGHATGGLISAGLIPPQALLVTVFFAIYSFHMPLFFFVSGLLTPARISRGQWGFLTSLLPTLVLPYFLWSAIQLSTILLASSVVNAPLPYMSARWFLALLWVPTGQFWFLYVLMICHVLATLVGPRLGWLSLIVLSFCLYPLADPSNDAAVLKVAVHFLPFYALGAFAGATAAIGELPKLLRRAGLPALSLAAATVGISVFFALRDQLGYWSPQMFAAGVAGTVFVLTTVTLLPHRLSEWFAWLGKRAMPIFILHVLFIAGLRILLDRVLHLALDASVLWILVPFGIIAPLIVFAVAERLGLSRILGFGTLRRVPTVAQG